MVPLKFHQQNVLLNLYFKLYFSALTLVSQWYPAHLVEIIFSLTVIIRLVENTQLTHTRLCSAMKYFSTFGICAPAVGAGTFGSACVSIALHANDFVIIYRKSTRDQRALTPFYLTLLNKMQCINASIINE